MNPILLHYLANFDEYIANDHPIKVKLLDTETGETAWNDQYHWFDWAENNWSCDCNRMREFDLEDDGGYCVGAHRYLIIETDPPCSREELLELNSDYPSELTDKHIPMD